MAKLILFDIDGTLVLTGGAGARAMLRAFAEVFGPVMDIDAIPMAGRTDAWIVAQMAARHGHRADDPAVLQRFHDTYVELLTREIHEPGPKKGVLPGVRPLLDRLAARGDVGLALLTGNFARGAEIKLRHFDLWRYFPCGAFGDEVHDRNALLATALARAEACGIPSVPMRDVIVVGDTPLDIAVAVAGGARSLGVATGSYSVDDLLRSGADAAVQDLSDVEEVLERLDLRPARQGRTG